TICRSIGALARTPSVRALSRTNRIRRQHIKILPEPCSEEEYLLGTIRRNPPCSYCQLPVPRALPKFMSGKVARSKTVLSLNERVVERHELMQRQGRDWSHKLLERDGLGLSQLNAVVRFDRDERAGYYVETSLDRGPSWLLI